ncbi:ABC transporter ATP-binding protein [Streptomyces orinoci]|uniref:ABC transporter ATP-binding protein n=1 Tax=Streptomyces orinoci TaxID=67339 RepID=A0ABV3JT44_STRON|nr:ABC transporter ATP-binding protein [Streptomyces orinoci]
MEIGQTAATAVRLSGLRKSYPGGAAPAVDGLDLTIRRGEMVALLGRNGAGKSTTVAMMLGLLEPDEGRVELFGCPAAQAVRAGQVSAMMQEGGLVSRVTVAELIRFVRRAFPRPLPTAEILRAAGLEGLARKRVDRLSGGQAQRVRFAMALAGDPQLLVLDEPTAALDVEARRELWAALRRYAARGRTIVFSTHYLEEADANADRVVVIDRGRLVADGTSAELKQAAAGRIIGFADPGMPVSQLAMLPGVLEAETRGGRVRLRTVDADATLAALGPVRGLEVTGAGLEDAFVALTGAGR